jgi:hypothetical protein
MKRLTSADGLGLLILGLILGLALAFSIRLVLSPGAEPFSSRELGELVQGDSISTLGPITLIWSTGETDTPLSADFSIDSELRVSLEQTGNSLRLSPIQPLSVGEHILNYQPADGPPAEWLFEVRPPEPLYLQEAAGQRQLFRWREGEPLLLSADHLVTNYAPTLQGDRIAYTAANDQGGSDLWQVDREAEGRRLLFSCGADRCGQLAWSPDGARLAFSRAQTNGLEQSRIWTMGAEAEQAAPLFQDEGRQGLDPNWSPDGRRLAFYDPAVNGVRILDLDTVREEVVPTRAGVSGAWSADGQQLYLPLLVFIGEEPVTHLYRLQLADRQLDLVLGEQAGWRRLGEPALPLVGDWLAVAGQQGSSMASLGLWLVNPESGEASSLVVDERFSYGGPSWDALGQQLLFQRFPLGQDSAAPDLMRWIQGSDGPELLLEGAGSADWLN